MIDAYEAYKLSKQASINEKVLDEIEEKIKKACKQGEFEISYLWSGENLASDHEAIKSQLKAKSYHVIDQYSYTPNTFRIEGIRIHWGV